eukprot:gene3859-7019_t
MFQKYYLSLLFFVFLLQTVTANWTTTKNTKAIEPKTGFGYAYNTAATAITWSISCSKSCNVYLLDETNKQRLSRGLSYTSFFEKIGTTQASGSFQEKENIKKKLFIFVLNESSDTITANFEQRTFIMTDMSWISSMVFIIVLVSVGVPLFLTGFIFFIIFMSVLILIGVVGCLFCGMFIFGAAIIGESESESKGLSSNRNVVQQPQVTQTKPYKPPTAPISESRALPPIQNNYGSSNTQYYQNLPQNYGYQGYTGERKNDEFKEFFDKNNTDKYY